MMLRHLILYSSRTGTTEQFALDMGTFLSIRDVEPNVVSIFEFNLDDPPTPSR
jgi:menaquinone-dependent protoporphyrinogen IX oxidase